MGDPPLARLAGVEALRVVAAVGIVWFHTWPATRPIRDIGYFGVVVFVLISATFAWERRAAAGPFGPFVRTRALQLLVPYAAWNVFYFASLAVRKGLDHAVDRLEPTSVLDGTGNNHLWFLPFLFLTLVLIRLVGPTPVGRWFDERGPMGPLALGLALLVVQSSVVADLDLVAPWRQWASVVPAWFLAVAVARARADDVTGAVVRWTVPVATVTVALGVLVVGLAERTTSPWAYAVGVPAFCWALTWPRRPGRLCAALAGLAPLTLGVYLVHPFVILVGHRVLPAGGEGAVLVFAVVVSFAVVAPITRLPVVRRVV